MQLAKEMFSKVLAEQIMQHLSADTYDLKSLIEMPCYIALREIKALLEDDTFSDEVCLSRIEEVIHIFESIGSDGGSRHDYG